MKRLFCAGAGLVASICLFGGFAPCANAQADPPVSSTQHQEQRMKYQAIGTFDVTITPQASTDPAEAAVSRMSIDKQFHGGLEATSKGVMLAVTTDVEGSAGYVALERVTGTLNGRSGSFILQHSGIMDRGAPSLSVTVVPDSGTGEIKGIRGEMTIRIEGGTHHYEFDYTLSANP